MVDRLKHGTLLVFDYAGREWRVRRLSFQPAKHLIGYQPGFNLIIEPRYNGESELFSAPLVWFNCWYLLTGDIVTGGIPFQIVEQLRPGDMFYDGNLRIDGTGLVISLDGFAKQVKTRMNISDAHVKTLTARLRARKDMTRSLAALDLAMTARPDCLLILANAQSLNKEVWLQYKWAVSQWKE